MAGKLVHEMSTKYDGLLAAMDKLTERVSLLEGQGNEDAETEDSTNPNETLKKPRPQEAFDALRTLLYRFNKKNHKLRKHGKEVAKWGESGEFSTINTRESLVSWFQSVHAEGLSADIIEHYKVCVFRGKLVTLSKDYKGGIGIEALWIPDDKYDKVCAQSTRYKSPAHKKDDPRHGYELNGVKWAPEAPATKPTTKSKKRKATSDPKP